MPFNCLLRPAAALVLAAATFPSYAAPQPVSRANAATSATSGIPCRKLSVNGSNIVPGSTLTVTVNGTPVARHDQHASGELGQHMEPGLNRVGLSFAAPGEMGPFGTQAELRCLSPDEESSRDEILRLQPTAKRLSAEVQVNYVPR
jgi:hypothetical protein